MRSKVLLFCRYGKFLGLLGLPGLIWDLPLFNWLWLFWLLGLVEIAFDFTVFKQSLQLVIGMVTVPRKRRNNMPDKDNFRLDIEFDLPFDGSWVVVNGGVDKEFSHSWEIPCQRYAHDFLILDEHGKSHSGEATKAESYYCYGRDILAPADGVVAEVLDGQPNSAISAKGRADCAAKDIRGNHIVIEHGEHLYSLCAHLQAGSLLVKPGERVQRGQAIARCGNSGNSTEPHLHFQLLDELSFAYSAGLPINFSHIEAELCPGYAAYDPRPVKREIAAGGYISRGQLVRNRQR